MIDRPLYENEAFLQWQSLKENLPESIYKDLLPETRELRVFLSVGAIYELLVFSLEEHYTPRDACFMMKSRYEIDFCRLSKEEAEKAWEFYGCEEFALHGSNNETVTNTYNLGMAWGEGMGK